MSYDIIKSIRIEDNRVFICSAASNITPKTFEECECKSLSKLLQEQGSTATILEIFKQYENGNFKAGTANKYTKALAKAKARKDYPKFDWRNCNYQPGDPVRDARDSKSFDYFLLECLGYGDIPNQSKEQVPEIASPEITIQAGLKSKPGYQEDLFAQF